MVCYLHNVTSQLQLRDASTGQLRQSIPMPGLGSVAGFSGRKEDTQLFFKFTGFTEPGAIYQCDRQPLALVPDVSHALSQTQGGNAAGPAVSPVSPSLAPTVSARHEIIMGRAAC